MLLKTSLIVRNLGITGFEEIRKTLYQKVICDMLENILPNERKGGKIWSGTVIVRFSD